MSSPVVETVRTVPLIVEQGHPNIPMEVEEISGFPFDRDSDREGHFRSQLDDIAKRHPEFAEHLGNFTLRSSPRRQSSLGGTEDPDLHRRFQRPFGGNRFERFGFPFDRDDFDPEQYAQQFYQPQQEFDQQQQSSYSQPPPEYHQADQSQEQHCSQPQSTESFPPTPEKSNIHQSNTVDLGQKQEPVNDRNQRSMSAPPPEKGQRFTSSINIPVNQPQGSENMAQAQPHQAETKTERIIPIHIEGRSEPVLPKTAPPTYGNGPQPEKIFGQRPENFTQFVNREPPRQYEKWHPHFDHHGFNQPDEFARQQRYSQQEAAPPHHQQHQKPTAQQQKPAAHHQTTPHQQQHAKDEIPIPVQVEVPHNKQQVPPQQQQQAPQQPKPAPQQKKPLMPLEQIQAIQDDISALMSQAEQFAGKPKDKQYLYLDEMLTRNLLKLDNVDTQGQDSIRSARKEAIRCIEKAIGVLEAKAAANVEPPKLEEKMEVEEKLQEAQMSLPLPPPVPESKEATESELKDEAQAMETEQLPVAEMKDNKNEDCQHQQPMELVPGNAANVETDPQVGQTEETKIQEKVENGTAIAAPAPQNVETKVETQVAVPVENKSTEVVPTMEESKMETCERQESNLPVAEAVKKFEGNVEKKEERSKEESTDSKQEISNPEENKESSQNKEDGDTKVEDKKGEKKEKKKIKKKGEKKEK